MKKIHIFKTGTHIDSNGTSVSFSEQDLQNAINAYNPAIHQAPIVVGHPKTDAPAFGWVKSLAGDNGNLYAIPEQIQHDFGEQVKQGLFKKVSASFYPPNSPTNPVKGVYYLRHIGFLGAEPPAIKGLEPIEFNENDKAVELTFDFSEQTDSHEPKNSPEQNLFNKFVSALGTLLFSEQSQSTPPSDTPPSNEPKANPPTHQKDNPMTDTQTPPTNPSATPDPKDAEIASLKAELAKKEAEQAQAQITAQNQANNDFAENLVKDGKLTPAHKDMVVAVLNAIDTANRANPLNFGEGDKAEPLNQAFKNSLSAGLFGKAHLFGESASKNFGTTATNFDQNLPPSVQVDSDSIAKHQEILAYCETHNVDYTTAVMAIG
ncbi:MAG: hypothetical protein Q4G13_00200 [Moraxella sp.]|nr:hypothetical protein [Moraxella sp.]